MPIRASRHFDVPNEKIRRLGAFDPFLDLDSHVFINPALIKDSGVPEFKSAYPALLKYYREILHVLVKSDGPGDVFWKEASRRLRFTEIQGTCIGYAGKGTAGHGFGEKLRDELLSTLFQLVKKGIEDPKLFELVSIFQENVGCDLISDMVAHVLREQLHQFTDRVTKDLDLPSEQMSFQGKPYRMPRNPFNKRPLIFLPEDILDDLPMAMSWDDIYIVTAKNEAVRNAITKIIGHDWAKASKRALKHEMKKLFLDNPKVLAEMLKAQDRIKQHPYNFDTDPHGRISWHDTALNYATSHPLPLSLHACASVDDVYAVVKTICDDFRRAVEDRGLWKNLYKKYPKPHHEGYSQRLFQTIAEIRCQANNLDLAPETNRGGGPIDFKVSHGTAKVLVEVKLSKNGKLLDGYTKQLEAYRRAEGDNRAVYLVVEVGETQRDFTRLLEAFESAKQKDAKAPELYFVNARRRPSASKL